MIKAFSSILLLSIVIGITAQEVSVAIYYERKPQGVTLTVQKGTYLVYNDFELVDTLQAGNNISVIKESEYLVYRNRAKAWATDKNIRIVNTKESAFFINYTGSVEPARCYEGWMKFSVDDYSMQVLNYVPLDSYVAAIVEGQGGGMSSEEFFKARSVMIRTYTVLNLGKHKTEGFDLCDGSHCQAYKNKATNRVIINAAKKTTTKIMVDKYKNLINPLYHQNSGGITIPAEFVWEKSESHLATVNDEFASMGDSYHWKTLIPATDWQAYLVKKGLKSAESKLHKQLLVKQENERLSDFIVGKESIKLHTVKSDWGWKSSFFTMTLNKGVITVIGRGSGHGVGMSIESSKAMASKGYQYDYILTYFYKNIRIIQLNELSIYNQILANNKKEKP